MTHIAHAIPTTAQQVARLFGNDGQCASRDGLEIETECRRYAPHPETDGFGRLRFDFDDGSSIVICDGIWDFGAEGCSAYCWDGGGCDCDCD